MVRFKEKSERKANPGCTNESQNENAAERFLHRFRFPPSCDPRVSPPSSGLSALRFRAFSRAHWSHTAKYAHIHMLYAPAYASLPSFARHFAPRAGPGSGMCRRCGAVLAGAGDRKRTRTHSNAHRRTHSNSHRRTHVRARARKRTRAHTLTLASTHGPHHHPRRQYVVRSHGSVTCVPAPEPSFGGLGPWM